MSRDERARPAPAGSETDRRKQYLDALMKEYERVCVEIRTLEGTNEKIVGFAVTFLTVFFSYASGTAGGTISGTVGNAPKLEVVIFLFVPVGFTCVFIYAVMQYYRVLRYGGYKKLLEERINAKVGEPPALFWEKLVSTDRKSDIINNALYIGYAVVTLPIEAYCIWYINTHQPLLVSVLFDAVIAGLTFLLGLSWRQMGKAFSSSYDTSKELSEGRDYLPKTLLHSDKI